MTSEKFSVSLPNNVGHIHAMPYFRKLIGYIMNHATTTSTVKKQLQFLELLSKRNGPFHLASAYSALFLVDTEITDMYMFVSILINKTGPSLPLRIDLDITTNQVTVEEIQQNNQDSEDVEKTMPESPKNVSTAPVIEKGTDLTEDMETESNVHKDPKVVAPKASVQHESMIGKQVKLVHTHQGDASLASIEMVPTEGTGQGIKSKKNKNKNKNEKVTQPGQTNPAQKSVLQGTAMTRGDQSLASDKKSQDIALSNQNVTSTKQDDLPGFVPVTKGISPQKVSSSPESFVQIPSSQNRFDPLGDNDKDEDDEELDAREGTNKVDDDDSTDTPISIDLLNPPRSSILATVPVTPTKKTTKRKKKSPAHQALKDHGYRHRANGLQYIEDRLQQYKGDEISIEDLTWYISTVKPRMYHVKEQANREMAQLRTVAVEDCGAACQETANYYLMDLAKTAQAECNKLNTTSANIFKELDKATVICKDLKDHHTICTRLLRNMEGTTTRFMTSADFNREAELIDKRFQSRLKQTADSIVEVMKLEIAKHEQRIIDMETRLEARFQTVMEQKSKTPTTPSPTVLPVSKHKHPLFPQVDLTQFADAVPDPIHNVSNKPAVPEPNVSNNSDEPYIIPFNMKVRAMYKGRPTTCWMKQCYRNGNTLQYTATTSTGEQIRLHPSEITFFDMSETTPPAPHNYVVRIPGPKKVNNPYKPQIHMASPATTPDIDFELDDLSIFSQHESHHQPGTTMSRPLAPNAFIYPRDTGVRYIREDKASSLGEKFNENLAAGKDPKQFYTAIRQQVLPYNVLLLPYDHITTKSGLLAINKGNCDNYHTIASVMSSFLYNFFFQGKENMFDNHEYAKNSLTTYESDQNGIGFLRSLIRDRHPALRKDAIQTNITDHYSLPTFPETETFWGYILKLETYVTDVKRDMDQIDILRLIHDQLIKDPRFSRAATHLQEKIDKFREGNGSLPDRYTLKNVAITIMDLYDPQDKQRLSLPLRPVVQAIDVPTISINRAMTRSQTRGQTRSKTDLRAAREAHKEAFEKFCKCCLTYGHDAIECTKTGAMISIGEYLRNCTAEKKKEILQAYRRNRREAHERYMKSYKARRELKKQIKKLEFDMFPTDQSRVAPDPNTSDEYEKIRISYVETALNTDPDLNFGSLDNEYDDLEEPMLQFDPATDTVPQE